MLYFGWKKQLNVTRNSSAASIKLNFPRMRMKPITADNYLSFTLALKLRLLFRKQASSPSSINEPVAKWKGLKGMEILKNCSWNST
jgi:hypothetical protein